MSKKVASSVLVHHVKLKKRGKKKFFLRRLVDYLKSDTYMFAPLSSSPNSEFYSTATASASFSGVDPSEPIWEKNKNLLQKMKDYMVSDQYLYAPLVQPLFHSAIDTSKPQDKGPTLDSGRTDTNNWNEPMKKLSEETRDPEQRRKGMRIEELRVGRYPYGSSTIIRRTQLQKEAVTHMVQQNCRS